MTVFLLKIRNENKISVLPTSVQDRVKILASISTQRKEINNMQIERGE